MILIYMFHGRSKVESSSTCDCSSTQFIPICGNDGRNYYSPCHAGCHNITVEVTYVYLGNKFANNVTSEVTYVYIVNKCTNN